MKFKDPKLLADYIYYHLGKNKKAGRLVNMGIQAILETGEATVTPSDRCRVPLEAPQPGPRSA